MAKHATLSPSSAKRWTTCTPSARLEQTFQDEGSEAAREGTLAHELSELIIRHKLGLVLTKPYQEALKVIEKDDLYRLEMFDHCEEFAVFVVEQFHEAQIKTKDAMIFLEQRVDMARYVPEGFGIADVVIIADGTMVNIDLKYGKGVYVETEDNHQMMLYSLGILDEYDFLYNIKHVQMMIHQPRKENFGSWTVEAAWLKKWGEEYLIPRAKLAWEGAGEFEPGDHCYFCKAKTTCKANADHQLTLAAYAFRDAVLLGPEEVADILVRTKPFLNWIDAVNEYALDQALNHGVRWPGHKLVTGRSNRKYTDEEAIIQLLREKGFDEDTILKKKLMGIGDLTKLLGTTDFNTYISDYTVKPAGKPSLVPEADKRPEYHSDEAASKAFDD